MFHMYCKTNCFVVITEKTGPKFRDTGYPCWRSPEWSTVLALQVISRLKKGAPTGGVSYRAMSRVVLFAQERLLASCGGDLIDETELQHRETQVARET